MRCPQVPNTIGEHIRKRRIELGLEQTQVAETIGVHRGSIQNWERNCGTPLPKQLPAIIKFLGFVPFASEATFGQRVAFLRKCAGLTQRELSEKLGGSTDMVWRWESSRSIPLPSKRVAVLERIRAHASATMPNAPATAGVFQ